MGIERKSRNRRSIGVQTCAKGLGTEGRARGVTQKEGAPRRRGGWWRWFSACLQRWQRAEFYLEAYCWVPLFFQPPKPDFQTHTTLFSLGAPLFFQGHIKKELALVGVGVGAQDNPSPSTKAQCSPHPALHTQCQPSSRGQGQADHGLGEYSFSGRGCVGTGIGPDLRWCPLPEALCRKCQANGSQRPSRVTLLHSIPRPRQLPRAAALTGPALL